MLNCESEKITILGSGVALGVYIPALLVNYQLRKLNLDSDVMVLENYYTDDSREKLKAYKKAYHTNFSVALMGHKMTKDISASLDDNLVNNLLENWQAENRLKFIVWSGLWMPILEKYREQIAPKKLNVDACRIDADISATFKINKSINQNYNEIWLWNWEQKKLIHEIPVTNQPPIPYADRKNRFVIHGGGWGIGTYQSRIAELEAQGILLDIVAYYPEETERKNSGNRYFMVDPDWSPWIKNQNNQHEFPPFGEVSDLNNKNFQTKEEHHLFHDLVKQSKAIISKPGGGTLIDSLASATPIILLEAYGYAEEKNAAIWEYLGYGISYEKWKKMNYSLEILEQLHQNLLNKNRLINYPQQYADRLLALSCKK
ncbi:hypothetical protein PN499_18345 [Kamptonema animale CS-326]|jgi:hypothetical protein|uniref:hypothetical protein n=1 Tax=Kamptonema animale TaxID=92934 RepID=UPI00232BFA8F|nr:hypothetical protein [Kamptonema animale]MDB9513157.1 hypothetical protein [Kamptonema animale CS-326]